MKINNLFNYNNNLQINNINQKTSNSINKNFNLTKNVFCLSNSNKVSFGLNPQLMSKIKAKETKPDNKETEDKNKQDTLSNCENTKEEEFWGDSACI